ncbi:MAG: DUF2510 domain-containing protein [Actinobacteria bacterium]|nr:DUF2510 domain-containing protein [Actinomycetota bacterium]
MLSASAFPEGGPDPAAGILPPANWYPDPSRAARLRYWDGERWTDQIAD